MYIKVTYGKSVIAVEYLKNNDYKSLIDIAESVAELKATGKFRIIIDHYKLESVELDKIDAVRFIMDIAAGKMLAAAVEKGVA